MTDEDVIMTDKVFILMTSWEDERESHELRPKNGSWNSIGEILRGERPVSEYEPLDLVGPISNAPDWDFYNCPGTLGMLSRRAVEIFEPYLATCFQPLEATVNGSPFFFLRIISTIDCLNRERSTIIPFNSDPTDIMRIERYYFKKDLIPDPVLFVIPEGSPHLFGSHSIPGLITKNSLRGIEAIDTEDPPSWLNY
jgi:hypothetical protein